MNGLPPGARYRTFFWPGLLILVGVFALLINTGTIPSDRLYRLSDLWPVLPIVVGLLLLIRRSAMPSPAATATAAAIVVLAVAGSAAYVAVGPPIANGSFTAIAPAGGIRQATLEIDAGTSTLHIQGSSSMTHDLYQAQVKYSGPPPAVTLDREGGRVLVTQNTPFGLFGKQSIDLSMQLNIAVHWSFVVHSGSSTDAYDLANVNVGSIEIDTGASQEDISLGTPSGKVPITVNGGALTVHLHRAAGAAASVKVTGGSVSLDFDGDRSTAVGSLSHSTGESADMFEVGISGGSCTVTMDTGASSG